jgi:hypothetical protein
MCSFYISLVKHETPPMWSFIEKAIKLAKDRTTNSHEISFEY